jgi:hypothetical protein
MSTYPIFRLLVVGSDGAVHAFSSSLLATRFVVGISWRSLLAAD